MKKQQYFPMNDFQRGYAAGVQKAKKVINRDVKYIFSSFAKVLHLKHGNSKEDIMQVISDVQEEWQSMEDNGIEDLDRYLEDEIGFTIWQEEN